MFASSNYQQLRYIAEVTQGLTPGAGNGVNLRMLDPTFKAAVSTVKSAEITSTRMVSGSTNVDMNVEGGFNFELSGKEYDPFLAGMIYGAFAHYGTAGLGTAFSATTIAGSITAAVAPVGSSDFTTLGLGRWFKLVPPSGASQAIKDYFADKWLKTHASTPATTTVITLDPATPLAGVGIVTGVAGYQVSSSIASNGATTSFFTFEDNFTDITQFLAYTGMQPNTMSLDIAVGAIIKGSMGFLGKGHTIGAATTLPGAPVASQSLEVMNAVTDVGLVMENGASILSANSFIKSVKFNIANNLRGQKAVGTFGNSGVGVGELAVGGALEVYFEDATYYNKWLQGTSTSLAMGMADSLGNGYLIELDKVKFKDGALGGLSKDQDVMLSLPFDAFYNAGTSRGIRITRAVGA
jgi:hypothetical protein